MNRSFVLRTVFSFALVFMQQFAWAVDGVTDTEIVIGAHTVESGPNAFAINDYKAMQAWFDKINAAGGIHGRKIKLLHIDTQNIYAKSFEATKRLVEQDKIFAMVGSIGTSHQSAHKYLIEKGIPDLFFNDVTKMYGNPFQKTVFPYQPYIGTEGVKLGEYAVKRFPGKRACFLVRDEPWSAEYKAGVTEGITEANKKAKSQLTIGIENVIDRNSAQANAEVLKLKEDKCDVVFAVLFGGQFGSTINFGLEQGFKPQWIFPNISAQEGNINLVKPEMRAGIIFPTAFALDEMFKAPGWEEWVKVAKAGGIPYKSGGSVEGWARGEMFTEALKKAGKDLTHESLIKGVEKLGGWKCGVCLKPLSYTATDHTAFSEVAIIQSKDGGWAPAP